MNTASIRAAECACVAVISTQHVTEKDSEIIPRIAWNNDAQAGIYWIHCTGVGWIFRINTMTENWSECLRSSGITERTISNLQYINDAGYDWVYFEANAPHMSGLPHWDW